MPATYKELEGMLSERGLEVYRMRAAIKEALDYIDNYDGQDSFLTRLEEILSEAITPEQ
jgi:hypothetical protein